MAATRTRRVQQQNPDDDSSAPTLPPRAPPQAGDGPQVKILRPSAGAAVDTGADAYEYELGDSCGDASPWWRGVRTWLIVQLLLTAALVAYLELVVFQGGSGIGDLIRRSVGASWDWDRGEIQDFIYLERSSDSCAADKKCPEKDNSNMPLQENINNTHSTLTQAFQPDRQGVNILIKGTYRITARITTYSEIASEQLLNCSIWISGQQAFQCTKSMVSVYESCDFYETVHLPAGSVVALRSSGHTLQMGDLTFMGIEKI